MHNADLIKTIRLTAAGFMLVAVGALSLPAFAACECKEAPKLSIKPHAKAHKTKTHRTVVRKTQQRIVQRAPLTRDSYVWEPHNTSTYIDFGQRAYNPPPDQSASVYISPPARVVEIPPPVIIPAPRGEPVLVQRTITTENRLAY